MFYRFHRQQKNQNRMVVRKTVSYDCVVICAMCKVKYQAHSQGGVEALTIYLTCLVCLLESRMTNSDSF